MTRMPRAAAVLATRRPTLPTPMMPSVLPFISSRPCQRLLPQSARRVRLSTTTACLARASMSMIACSATELEFEPGAWTTGIPRSVAAGRSMVSRPTPWRPTTLSCLHAAIKERVHRGLARKRIPDASWATLTMPASLSSLETITRASLSSCLTPSAWMGPARMTRGFMALLSEGEGHLHDSERRIGLERIALARVGEPQPLVQSRGGAVALGHPQDETPELPRTGPLDGGTQQSLPHTLAPGPRLHPHAPHVAGLRALLVEKPEGQPEGPTIILRHEHHLPARHGHRLSEPDPMRIGLGLFVDEAPPERVRRVGEGAEPQLTEEGPLTTLELANTHGRSSPGPTWSPRGRCGATRGGRAARRGPRTAPRGTTARGAACARARGRSRGGSRAGRGGGARSRATSPAGSGSCGHRSGSRRAPSPRATAPSPPTSR